MKNIIEFAGVKPLMNFNAGQVSQGAPAQETADSAVEQYQKRSDGIDDSFNPALSRETVLQMSVGELGHSLSGMPHSVKNLAATTVDVLSSDPKIFMGSSTLESIYHAATASLSGALCAAAGAAGAIVGGVPGGIASVLLVTLLTEAVERVLSPHTDLDLSLKPLILATLGAVCAPLGMPLAAAGGAIGIHCLDRFIKAAQRDDMKHNQQTGWLHKLEKD